MARQAGLFTARGPVVISETGAAQRAPSGGIFLAETGSSGGAAAGTANGAATVLGVPPTGTNGAGTANGQATVSGATNQGVGTANGQASAAGAGNALGNQSGAGTANGQASAQGVCSIAPGAGTANGHASAQGFSNAIHVADAFTVAQDNPWFVGIGKTVTQAMTVHPSQTIAWHWGRTIAEMLHIHRDEAVNMIYALTERETFKLGQILNWTLPVHMTQAMTIGAVQAVGIGVQVLQALRLIPVAAPVGKYHLALAQAMLLNSAFARFFGAALSDGMVLTPGLGRKYVTSPVLSQELTAHDAILNTLVLSFSDTIDITPDQLIQAIYQGDELIDGINLSGLYVSQAGAVTTWAINTRTNAVTNYDNYEFNGFAQMGNRYIGTSKHGVYELDGETDNGKYVIADILSGFMQLNATKMAGLKGVYLAIRGRGEFFLKLITGDGRELVYKTLTQPGLMNTKVNIGKGLRTRYIAFQLTSTGADFDIDSLEFVPMLSDRRV